MASVVAAPVILLMISSKSCANITILMFISWFCRLGYYIGVGHCHILCTTRFGNWVFSSSLLPHQCEYVSASTLTSALIIHEEINTVQSETCRQEISINHFFSRMQKQYRRTQRKATLINSEQPPDGIHLVTSIGATFRRGIHDLKFLAS